MPIATGERVADGISNRGLRALVALASIVLLCSCNESEPKTRFGPIDTGNVAIATTVPPASTLLDEPPAPWTERRFAEPATDGSVRSCIEVTVRGTTASACLGLPGVSSWTVAGQQFVLGRGDVSLTDGSTVRAGADGIALGVLPGTALPTADTLLGCDRHELAKAVAEHYPESAPVWVPTRCADAQLASVDALLADRSPVVGLLDRTGLGPWEVFATYRAPVRCGLLDVGSRVKCKLLHFDD